MPRSAGTKFAPSRGTSFPVAPKPGDIFELTANTVLYGPVRPYSAGLYRCISAAAPENSTDAVWLSMDPPEIGQGLKKRSTGSFIWDVNPGVGIAIDEDWKVYAKLKDGGGIIGSAADGLSIDPSFVGSGGGGGTTTVLPPKPIRVALGGGGPGSTTYSSVSRTFVGGLYAVTVNAGWYVNTPGLSAAYLRINGADALDEDGALVQSFLSVNQASQHDDGYTAHYLVRIPAGTHTIGARTGGNALADTVDQFHARFDLVSASAQPAGAAESWQTLPLAGSWAHIGGASAPPRIKRSADGTVKCKGLIRGGAVGSVVANLPDGYRPAEMEYLGVTCGVSGGSGGYPNGVLTVAPTGVVTYADGPALPSGAYMILADVEYTAAGGPTNVSVPQGDAIITTLPPRPINYAATGASGDFAPQTRFFTGGLYQMTLSGTSYRSTAPATEGLYPAVAGAALYDVETGQQAVARIEFFRGGDRETYPTTQALVQIPPGNHEVRVYKGGTTGVNAGDFCQMSFELVSPSPSPAGMSSPVVPLAFANPWSNYQAGGGALAPARYIRTAEGEVQLQGVVTGGVAGNASTQVVTVLPAGYRPSHPRYFNCPISNASGNTFAVVAVQPNGNVEYQVGGPLNSAAYWLSLDEISFQTAEGPTTKLGPANVAPEKIEVLSLPLTGVWAPYDNSSFNNPSFWRTPGNEVRFTGLLRSNGNAGNNTQLGTLPPGYRPAKNIVLDLSRSTTTGGRIDVLADGRVMWIGGATGAGDYYSLEGLSFVVADGPKAPGVRIGPIENTKPAVLTPTFQANWINYGGGYRPVKFWKEADGTVRIRGLMGVNAAKGAGSIAFYLPEGYRPTETEIFDVSVGGAFARVDIGPGGNVVVGPAVNAGTYIPLNIQFTPDEPVQAAVALGYVNEPLEVSTLPVSPANGTVVDLVIDSAKGLVYRCKYDERIPTASKWRVLGPARVQASDFKSGPFNFGNTSNAWTAMNAGPTLTLKRGVYALTIAGAAYANTATNGDAKVAPKIGSAAVVESNRLLIGAINPVAAGAEREYEITIPADDTVLTMQGATAASATVIDASLAVTPVLLG